MAQRSEQLLHTCCVVAGGRACVQIAGELDLATAPQVDRAVQDCLARRPLLLELDLDCLTFCDATGLRALLRARDVAKARGCAFRLTGSNPRVRRIFALLGVPEPLLPPPAPAPAKGRSGIRKTTRVCG